MRGAAFAVVVAVASWDLDGSLGASSRLKSGYESSSADTSVVLLSAKRFI